MELVQLLLTKGGIVMYPLFLLSFAAAFLIFRGFYLYRSGYFFPAASQINWQAWSKDHTDEMPVGKAPVDTLLQSLHSRKQSGTGQDVENELVKLRFRFEGTLDLLENVAGISPLLGLAGTVLGIIRIFQGRGTADSSTLLISQGISEALFTTIAGLFIAIPAIFFHNLLRRRLNATLLHVEEQIGDMLPQPSPQKP